MTKRILFLLAAAALAASAQKNDPHKMRAWFRDGSGVEFDTESTGSTSLASSGGALVVDDNGIHRVVADKAGNILYAYGIEAFAGSQPGTVSIRVKPLDAEYEASLRDGSQKGLGLKVPSGAIGTVATVREFSGLKKGQAVTLEILYNPSTGEKIYDILRPSTDVKPYPELGPGADSVAAAEELSLREIALVVNGQKITPPAGWLTGAAARLYLPGHGAYFLAAYQPKTAQAFRHVVYADQHNLEFTADGDFVRVTSRGNVLTRSESGIVWVYHDPKYQPASRSEAVDLVFADKVESLLWMP